MRQLTTILIALGFLCVAGIAADQSQQKAAPPGVAELIEKLGSPKFAEREQATKELETLGVATLPFLRTALKSDDAEIRRRAEILVRKFEDQLLTTKLLTGKRMRLNLMDAFISEAEAELTKLGFPVRRPAHMGARNDIKITLDTGETTFWEALHQLGMRINSADPTLGMSEKPLAPNEVEMPFLGSTKIPIGELVSKPTCFAGSVRITLLRAASQPNGAIDLTLEVVCEPHLLDFANTGSVRLDRGVDTQSKLLTQQPGTVNPGMAKPAKGVVVGYISAASIAVTPTAGFQSFQVSMRLPGAHLGAKLLTAVSGRIPVTTTVEAEPMMLLDNVLAVAGQTARSKDGKTLKLLEIEKAINGEVTVSVEMENPVQNPAVGPVAIEFKKEQRVYVNGELVGAGGEMSALRLLDSEGKDFTQVGVTALSGRFSNQGMYLKETIVFAPKPGQGRAARLMLPGYRSFSFEVPFTFTNIPLTQDRW